MTYKRIEYDAHATRRMQQRGISRSDVRRILATGLWQPEQSRPGGDARFSKRGYIGRREAQIVYLENAQRIYVITAEWIGDPPGEPE